jgi:hypothetical protein
MWNYLLNSSVTSQKTCILKTWESRIGTNGIVPDKIGTLCTSWRLTVKHFDGFTQADNDVSPPHWEQDLDQLCSLTGLYTDERGDDCKPFHTHKAMEYMGEL